jgi:hypothetical protein
MKGKQLVILSSSSPRSAAHGKSSLNAGQSSWSETSAGAGGKIVEFPINDVAHVVIKTPAGELNLVKKSDVWTVKGARRLSCEL